MIKNDNPGTVWVGLVVLVTLSMAFAWLVEAKLEEREDIASLPCVFVYPTELQPSEITSL